MVKATPEGYHTLTPYIVVRDGKKALQFYQDAFGAKVTYFQEENGGKIMHAQVQIGDSYLMLSDECSNSTVSSPETLKGTAGLIFVYVEDVDSFFDRAVKAGAKVKMPVADMFWGDRYGQIQDPFGHVWAIATHVEDLTRDQIEERSKKFFAKGKK